MDGLKEIIKRKAQKIVWKSLPTYKKAIILTMIAASTDALFFNGNVFLRKIKRIK